MSGSYLTETLTSSTKASSIPGSPVRVCSMSSLSSCVPNGETNLNLCFSSPVSADVEVGRGGAVAVGGGTVAVGGLGVAVGGGDVGDGVAAPPQATTSAATTRLMPRIKSVFFTELFLSPQYPSSARTLRMSSPSCRGGVRWSPGSVQVNGSRRHPGGPRRRLPPLPRSQPRRLHPTGFSARW